MTSKISYIKLIREDIRHRGWLAALTGIVLFLGMPVHAMLCIDSYLGGNDPNRRAYWTEYIQDMMPTMVNGYDITFVAYAIILLGALGALTGYSFIHSRERSDFYHSFPLKRGQWFTVSYFSGVIIFVIPYVICSGLTALAGAAYNIMTPEIFGKMELAAAGGILAFLVVYNVCILAAVLTGQTVTGILASLVIAVYPAIAFGMIPLLKSTFFQTYSVADSSFLDRLAIYASPAGAFIDAIQETTGETVSFLKLLFVILMIVVLLAGAVLLYRIYPAEASGRALSFSGMAPVFKVLICIPAALFCGIFVSQFVGIEGTRWLFFLCFFAVVLLCGVVEFIYQQDLKMLLNGWRSSLICIGTVFAVLCVFRFDLFGYDAYLPEEDKVESMSLRSYFLTGYFEYPSELREELEEIETYGVFTENFTPIYLLAEEGVKNAENGIDPQNIYSGDIEEADSANYIDTTICYKLKSGRKVVRDYCVERETILSALEELCRDDGYRQKLFPVFMVEGDSSMSISLRDVYGGDTDVMKLTEEERDTLLAAYRKDLMEADIRILADASPVGEIELYTKDSGETENTDASYGMESSYVLPKAGSGPGRILLGSQYIYESFEHTLACLEGYGYKLRMKINPEEVSTIRMYLSDEIIESGKIDAILSELSDDVEYLSYPDMDDELTVRSQADISIIAEHLKAVGSGFLSGNGPSVYADVMFRGGMSYNYEVE
mgnify:FL=1